ncbi:MAG TPA: hypothetical protein V6D47_08950 [Oscillatoriaceae cyanobacterium]
MSDKNLFEFVKGILKSTEPGAAQAPRPRPRRLPAVQGPDPDAQNPATIVRIGRSTDGRELIMTQGMGTFLVDRETPSICYYQRGQLLDVPTPELQNLYMALMHKRQVDDHALHYVDLLNVTSFEIETRRSGRARMPVKPLAPTPLKPREAAPGVPDGENPATITRVGRSANGAELVMTLGLGTFVVHRDQLTLRYYDRGREWDVPDLELKLLIDSLMAKQAMQENRFAYIDLLNVANFVLEQRRGKKR